MFTLFFKIPGINNGEEVNQTFIFENFPPYFDIDFFSKGILRYQKDFESLSECKEYAKALAQNLIKNLEKYSALEENAELIETINDFINKINNSNAKTFWSSLEYDKRMAEFTIFESLRQVNISFYLTKEEYEIYCNSIAGVTEMKDALIKFLKKHPKK